MTDGILEGGVKQIVIVKHSLLAVAVLAQVIIEAVDQSRLAIGKGDLDVEVFLHLSVDSALVTVIC